MLMMFSAFQRRAASRSEDSLSARIRAGLDGFNLTLSNTAEWASVKPLRLALSNWIA